MNFKEYTNRYGKKMVLEQFMLNCFELMKANLLLDGVDIEMTDGWRGEQDQDAAKASGHSKAAFGHSPHNFGVAFDVAPVIDGTLSWPSDMTLWRQIASEGIKLGLTWGGNFHSIVDLPHFETTGWRSMDLMLYSEAPPLSAD